jgi:hypothetical protein
MEIINKIIKQCCSQAIPTASIFILKFLLIKYLTKRKSKVYSCFIDLRRVFATVWHADLLYRLKRSSAKLRLLIEVSSKHTGSHVPSNIEWRSLIK